MVDLRTVCCLCGDVGFSDKLFRCSKCLTRFQHSYCSNYYCREYDAEHQPIIIQVCDWCQCRKRNYSSSKSAHHHAINGGIRSAYSGEKLKQHTPGKSAGKIPSRRYKLLKDVMC